MRGEVARTAIGFGFYDTSGRFSFGGSMNQYLADTLAGDSQYRTGVKVA